MVLAGSLISQVNISARRYKPILLAIFYLLLVIFLFLFRQMSDFLYIFFILVWALFLLFLKLSIKINLLNAFLFLVIAFGANLIVKDDILIEKSSSFFFIFFFIYIFLSLFFKNQDEKNH